MSPRLRWVLLVLAIVALVVFTIIGFDVEAWDHQFGWLGLGLVLFVLAGLPWPYPRRSEP